MCCLCTVCLSYSVVVCVCMVVETEGSKYRDSIEVLRLSLVRRYGYTVYGVLSLLPPATPGRLNDLLMNEILTVQSVTYLVRTLMDSVTVVSSHFLCFRQSGCSCPNYCNRAYTFTCTCKLCMHYYAHVHVHVCVHLFFEDSLFYHSHFYQVAVVYVCVVVLCVHCNLSIIQVHIYMYM